MNGSENFSHKYSFQGSGDAGFLEYIHSNSNFLQELKYNRCFTSSWTFFNHICFYNI